MEAEDCHMSLPLRQGTQVEPDPELLARADDEPMDAAEDADDDDEELRAAMALSMAQPDEPDDDDDELKAAMAMSMQPQPASAPAAAPAQPKKPNAAEMKAKVKARFDELVASGKPPNEAAAQAIKDVQAEMAKGSA